MGVNMFESKYKIRFTQIDTFGHLNNAAYLEIYEWARWEWAEAGGIDVFEMTKKKGVGPAILHVDLNFHKEITAHEEIVVRTWFHKLDGFKGVIAQEMIKQDGSLASSVLFTFVMFNVNTRKVVKVPKEMKEIYESEEDYRKERAAQESGSSSTKVAPQEPAS
jgi:acyl-CoA thioester hydrolase